MAGDKNSRNGGKFTGTHTTFIPLAADVCDAIYDIPGVTKILAGYITPNLKTAHDRRVKFTDELGSVLLSVRDTRTMQEVRVYIKDLQEDRTMMARKLRDANIKICFRKPV